MAYSPTTARIARAALRHARKFHVPDLGCLDCGRLPRIPVVCNCGHTRCYMCVMKSLRCPCDRLHPIGNKISINLTVRNLVRKMIMAEKSEPHESLTHRPLTPESSSGSEKSVHSPSSAKTVILQPMQIPSETRHRHRRCNPRNCRCFSQKERIKHALELLKLGEYKEAVPHLAHAAATTLPVQGNDRRYAYKLLLKCVNEVLSVSHGNEQTLTREICRSIRAKCKNLLPNVELSDLECPICLETMSRPVTTPCGHTYCRMCISQTVRNLNYCALCRYPLEEADIAEDTSFVSAAVEVAKSSLAQDDSDTHSIPIFSCTVAFPTIPCPILILGPYHRNIIRRILDSGTRRFGMVTTYKDGSLAVSGTIVEVRDCVQLQDGRTILSTVGITRFRTLNRKVKEESHIAQVVHLKDVTLTEDEYASLNLERLAQSITEKVIKWLATLSIPILTDIEDAFGPMPLYKDEYRWWTNPDCPKWLWWIIAILPFSPELQVLMLSTIHLHKRMLAVSRTLDVIKHIGLNPSICY